MMTTRFYDNTILQRYFESEASPDKRETKRITAVLKPDLDTLFKFVNEHDSRLYKEVAYVGSYYQGQKVIRSDEFDYMLIIDIPTENAGRHHGPGGLYYGFKGCDSENHRAQTIPRV